MPVGVTKEQTELLPPEKDLSTSQHLVLLLPLLVTCPCMAPRMTPGQIPAAAIATSGSVAWEWQTQAGTTVSIEDLQ